LELAIAWFHQGRVIDCFLAVLRDYQAFIIRFWKIESNGFGPKFNFGLSYGRGSLTVVEVDFHSMGL